MEYKNAIRDLLALDVDVASMLPADSVGFGFDNNADALTLSSALTERHLSAAAKISQIVADASARHADAGDVLRADRSGGALRWSDNMPFGTRGRMEIKYIFPADGDYLIEAKPKENGANGVQNFLAEIHQFDIAVDGVTVCRTGSAGRSGPPQPAWTEASRDGTEHARQDEGHRARESR